MVSLSEPGAAIREELLAARRRAYILALRITRSPEDAEDAVQQAYLNACQALQAGPPPRQARTWFLKVVANAARNHLKTEIRRRRREAGVEAERAESPGTELLAQLNAALEELHADLRLPVSLCCEQGLTQREAAAVLELPRSTLAYRLNEGIERLRRTLERNGYPAAAVGVLEALRQAAPAVPAGLAGKLEAVVAGAMSAKSGGGVVAVFGSMSLASKLAAAGALAAALGAGGAVVWKQLPPRAAAAPKRRNRAKDGDAGARTPRVLRIVEKEGSWASALRLGAAVFPGSRIAFDGSHLFVRDRHGSLHKIDPKTGDSQKVNWKLKARGGIAWDGKDLWALIRRPGGARILRQVDRRTLQPKPGPAVELPAELKREKGSGLEASLVSTSRGPFLICAGGPVFQLRADGRSWKRLSREDSGGNYTRSGSAACFWGGRKWSLGPRIEPDPPPGVPPIVYWDDHMLTGRALPGARLDGEPPEEVLAVPVRGSEKVTAIAPAGKGRFWIAAWDSQKKRVRLLLVDTCVGPLAFDGDEKEDPKSDKRVQQEKERSAKKEKEKE